MIPSVNILGVRVSKVTMNDSLFAIDQMLIDGKQHFVATPNPEMIVAAQRDEDFKKILNSADLAVPDGVGLLWASHAASVPKQSRLAGIISLLIFPFARPFIRLPISQRVSGVDLVSKLAEHHAGGPPRWFLLGGSEGVAEETKQKLHKQFHDLSIVGTYAGSPNDPECVRLINQTQPTVLLVAFGHGKQEKWIAEHLREMPTVKVAIGVGGTFDFIAGTKARAPRWMRKIGLEWLWRVLKEPRRIKRIFTATVIFPMLVLQKVKNG